MFSKLVRGSASQNIKKSCLLRISKWNGGEIKGEQKLPISKEESFACPFSTSFSRMRYTTPSIAWHDIKPVFSVDFHISGRLATAGADRAINVRWPFHLRLLQA